ncbi:MAG: FAD:protein FMN transferase [Fenollaria massiliensis]
MNKRKISLLVVIALLFSLLASCKPKVRMKFSFDYFDSFDTLVKATGYFFTQEEADKFDKKLAERLKYYDNLFDCHKEHEGVNNVYTINKMAGKEKVKVDAALLDLISQSKTLGLKYDSRVNIAFGAVIEPWEKSMTEALENDELKAATPDIEVLKERAKYASLNNIIIDKEESTVYITDERTKINLGSVAKGYAVELICNELKEDGFDSVVLSAGGNVKTIGHPNGETKRKWTIGVENPYSASEMKEGDSEIYDILYTMDKAIVTSGDYQRFFYGLDNVKYNHIIDTRTLSSARNFTAVTVITKDSGIADFLSTLLFTLTYEEGAEVIKDFPDTEALWINFDNTEFYTDGLKHYSKSLGATN